MKRLLILLILVPYLGFTQTKPKSKTVANKNATSNSTTNGFTITGNIKGLADSTSVGLLNGQTGVLEVETIIKNEKFVLKGKMENPDFKLVVFNKKPPAITIFLDNSNVIINGNSAMLDKAIVTGSTSNLDFFEFTKMLAPYPNVFNTNAPFDSTASAKARDLCYEFVKKHSTSYLNPLAIYRYNQLSDDITKSENLFNQLTPGIKASPMGRALEKIITDAKQNITGSMFPDFTQTDTAGAPVKLSSLKGKYVLVDFWASWCRPCRQENPNVVSAFNKFKDKNFTIIGVSLDKAKDAWIQAIKMDNLTWTHVSDLQGWSNAIAQQNQVFQIPQNFLLDPTGKVIGKNLTGMALERALEKYVK